MKHKYIDERYPDYFIFGRFGSTVDVVTKDNDICSVPECRAKIIISNRDKIKHLLYKIADKYPEQFRDCFYD